MLKENGRVKNETKKEKASTIKYIVTCSICGTKNEYDTKVFGEAYTCANCGKTIEEKTN